MRALWLILSTLALVFALMTPGKAELRTFLCSTHKFDVDVMNQIVRHTDPDGHQSLIDHANITITDDHIRWKAPNGHWIAINNATGAIRGQMAERAPARVDKPGTFNYQEIPPSSRVINLVAHQSGKVIA